MDFHFEASDIRAHVINTDLYYDWGLCQQPFPGLTPHLSDVRVRMRNGLLLTLLCQGQFNTDRRVILINGENVNEKHSLRNVYSHGSSMHETSVKTDFLRPERHLLQF